MATTDPRDRIIAEHAPLVPVPRYSMLPDLAPIAHRYLAAEDGLWLEVRRPWLHTAWQIAESAIALPYGAAPALDPQKRYAFGELAIVHLVDSFLVTARQALPNEAAAWGIWNDRTRALEYRPCIAIDAGPAGIKLERPRLGEDEHFAVDIHSHGAMPAFFSATDDADDDGEVKLSMVLGRVDTDKPQVRIRLCLMGLFIVNSAASDAACRECGCTEDEPCEGGCEWVEPDICSRCA